MHLVAIAGTPLENNEKVDVWDMIRMIATARILNAKSNGAFKCRQNRHEHFCIRHLCFMAGANSIFAGDKLLTTPNPAFEEDDAHVSTTWFKTKGCI